MTTPTRAVALAFLVKFPETGSLTLARMAIKQYPLLFRTLESARSVFRILRGANGKESLSHLSEKRFVREPRKSGDPFKRIRKGLTHFKNWGPLQVDGPAKALVLSDIHIPYHHSAVITALQHGKKNSVNTILLNGDTVDFFTLSKFEKDPRKRNLRREIETTREFLVTIREAFPKARIIYKDGNHEMRWESYLSVKAPELLGIDDFTLDKVLRMADCGVEYVTDFRPIRLGKLNVLHGHEYRFAIANPVNAARGLFLRAKVYAMCGHFHQKSEHSENNLEQKSISTWSTGCLCEMHPDYAPLNNWSHGFAIVEVEKDGNFLVQNKFISGGKVY